MQIAVRFQQMGQTDRRIWRFEAPDDVLRSHTQYEVLEALFVATNAPSLREMNGLAGYFFALFLLARQKDSLLHSINVGDVINLDYDRYTLDTRGWMEI